MSPTTTGRVGRADLAAQLRHHRLGQLDADHRHPAGRQRHRHPAGADRPARAPARGRRARPGSRRPARAPPGRTSPPRPRRSAAPPPRPTGRCSSWADSLSPGRASTGFRATGLRRRRLRPPRTCWTRPPRPVGWPDEDAGARGNGVAGSHGGAGGAAARARRHLPGAGECRTAGRRHLRGRRPRPRRRAGRRGRRDVGRRRRRHPASRPCTPRRARPDRRGTGCSCRPATSMRGSTPSSNDEDSPLRGAARRRPDGRHGGLRRGEGGLRERSSRGRRHGDDRPLRPDRRPRRLVGPHRLLAVAVRAPGGGPGRRARRARLPLRDRRRARPRGLAGHRRRAAARRHLQRHRPHHAPG